MRIRTICIVIPISIALLALATTPVTTSIVFGRVIGYGIFKSDAKPSVGHICYFKISAKYIGGGEWVGIGRFIDFMMREARVKLFVEEVVIEEIGESLKATITGTTDLDQPFKLILIEPNEVYFETTLIVGEIKKPYEAHGFLILGYISIIYWPMESSSSSLLIRLIRFRPIYPM